jgi:hypothetical protein
MGSGTRAAHYGDPSPIAPLGHKIAPLARKTSAFPKTLRIETVAGTGSLARAAAVPLRFPRLKVIQ